MCSSSTATRPTHRLREESKKKKENWNETERERKLKAGNYLNNSAKVKYYFNELNCKESRRYADYTLRPLSTANIAVCGYFSACSEWTDINSQRVYMYV